MKYKVEFFNHEPSISMKEDALNEWLSENKNITIHTISDDFRRILYSTKEQKKKNL